VAGSTARRTPEQVVTPYPVCATRAGFYGGQRIRPGQEFYLDAPEDFSATWMVKDPRDPRPAAPTPAAGKPAKAADLLGGEGDGGEQQPTGKADVFGDD
jgi:hypothetical protein